MPTARGQNDGTGELPAHAICVFRGAIFDVWQWEQEMYDGSKAIFEKIRRPDTVVVIPTVGNSVLTLLQEQPDWVSPKTSVVGGRCDWGEDPLNAAKRELLEETGYTSDHWTHWKGVRPYGKLLWTVHTYIARNCVYRQAPQPDHGEKIEVRPASFDEFLALADDQNFYEHELVTDLVRARFDPTARENLHTLLFEAR